MSEPEVPVGQPLLRVVRGEPTPEELAALIAVVTSRASASGAPPVARSAWNDPARLVRPDVTPSRNGWRRSALPH